MEAQHWKQKMSSSGGFIVKQQEEVFKAIGHILAQTD